MKRIYVFLLLSFTLLQAVDIQFNDIIEFEGIFPYRSISVDEDVYITNLGRTIQVLRIEDDGVEVLDRETQVAFCADIPIAHGDTLYFPRLHKGIDVYTYHDGNLEHIDTILDETEPTIAYLYMGMDVMDSVMFQCHQVFPDDGNYHSSWELYSVTNLLEPRLIGAWEFSENGFAIKAFERAGRYYFIEYEDVIKMCEDLSTMELQPATDDWQNIDAVTTAEYFDDHLFLTAHHGEYLFLEVFSFEEDGTLTREDTFPLYYVANRCSVLDGEEIVYCGASEIAELSVIRFHWENGELTQREDIQPNILGSDANLKSFEGGYLIFTTNRVYKVDHDFHNIQLLSDSNRYWVWQVLLNRFLLMSISVDDMADIRYTIYDLQERCFLPFETNGWIFDNTLRYNQDVLLFEQNSYVEVVKLGDNGLESVTNLDMPNNYLRLDILEDIACFAKIENQETYYSFYRIEGEQLVFLNEFWPDYYCSICMFTDPRHIIFVENYYYHLGYHYYRIEDDYSVTELMFVPGEHELYLTDSIIAPSEVGVTPMNIEDPDHPYLLDTFDLPGYQLLNGYICSFNGESKYLYSDCYFNNYITDYRFNVLYRWQDSRGFYLNDNNILLNDGNSLVLAQINGLGSAEDAVDPVGNRLSVNPNYPNPFNPRTVISYSLDQAGYTEIEVYNVTGQKVRTLLRDFQPTGNHSVEWDGRDDYGRPCASGVYLYRVRNSGKSCARKMLLLK